MSPVDSSALEATHKVGSAVAVLKTPKNAAVQWFPSSSSRSTRRDLCESMLQLRQELSYAQVLFIQLDDIPTSQVQRRCNVVHNHLWAIGPSPDDHPDKLPMTTLTASDDHPDKLQCSQALNHETRGATGVHLEGTRGERCQASSLHMASVNSNSSPD